MTRMKRIGVVGLLVALAGIVALAQEDRPVFEPSWESLNSREVPEWFRDAKFGIFIHWGVYSVPAICHKSTYSEWYWWWLKTNSHDGFVRKFHEKWYGKDFKYQEFAPMFRAELWEPDQWAKLFKRAGARYVVLVSKHHDGYALWPSEHASRTRDYPWNSTVIGPMRDICGELAGAVRAEGLKMGFYFSFMEWENPLYDTDKARYVADHMIPQIKDLVTRYKPSVFWPDGEWNHPDTLWRSPEILAWLYNNVENHEEFLVNDRWGKGLRGQAGDYYTTEYGSIGGDSPGLGEAKPFEECRGIGRSFAFNRLENYDDYQTRESLIRMFITLVSEGGGLLLNLGPDGDGTIPVIMQDRLVAMGEWLDVNGEAIYGTRKGVFDYLPWGRSTVKGDTLYLHLFDWPGNHHLEVPGLMTRVEKATLLHDAGQSPLELSGNGSTRLIIDLSGYHPFPHASVVRLELEGEPVVKNFILPEADGRLVLPARRAKLAGPLRIEQNKGKARDTTVYNIGYWLNLKGIATWKAAIKPYTTYEVVLVRANKPGTEGGRFELTVGQARLEGEFATHTGGWQTYEEMSLGTLTAGVEEEVTITLKALHIESEALTNIQQIVLKPKS